MLSHLNFVEVSKSAIRHNLSVFAKLVGGKNKIMAVVKSNAYGHGLLETAGILSEANISRFGVNSLEEALLLRKHGFNQSILVLGFIAPAKLTQAVSNCISFVVYRQDILAQAAKAAQTVGKQANIHLKIETGTNRQGISPDRLPLFLDKLTDSVCLEGVYTHFANIEDTLDPTFPALQLSRFKTAVHKSQEQVESNINKHAACTAATILFPETYFDFVRLGIGLYGFWPSRETQLSAKERGLDLVLQPALTWKTQIVQLKPVTKGEGVGYGLTYKAARQSKIAVLPVGYWDGFDRRLSNNGQVLVEGRRAPIVGRICMNMAMIDVTDIPGAREGSEVVLLGSQGKENISAEEYAQKVGTISYEIVTRINPLLPRIII